MSTLDVPGLVRVRKSCIPQAGLGVFAERLIRPGERLAEYKGVRLSIAEYDRRLDADPQAWLYILMLEEPEVYIDASDESQANWTRAINHPPFRCRPNCEFTADGWVRAIRKIPKNGELFIDYGPDYWKAAKQDGIERSKERLLAKRRDASPQRTLVL